MRINSCDYSTRSTRMSCLLIRFSPFSLLKKSFSRLQLVAVSFHSSTTSCLKNNDVLNSHHVNTHPIQVYNSLTKSKQPLKLAHKNLLYWYSCGPTVYSSAHIGHARYHSQKPLIYIYNIS